jgi:hypothetical protein
MLEIINTKLEDFESRIDAIEGVIEREIAPTWIGESM